MDEIKRRVGPLPKKERVQNQWVKIKWKLVQNERIEGVCIMRRAYHLFSISLRTLLLEGRKPLNIKSVS